MKVLYNQSVITNVAENLISNEKNAIDEFNKILLSDKPSIGVNLLFETNLLSIFFPELVKLHGKETINNHTHKDNFLPIG